MKTLVYDDWYTHHKTNNIKVQTLFIVKYKNK